MPGARRFLLASWRTSVSSFSKVVASSLPLSCGVPSPLSLFLFGRGVLVLLRLPDTKFHSPSIPRSAGRLQHHFLPRRSLRAFFAISRTLESKSAAWRMAGGVRRFPSSVAEGCSPLGKLSVPEIRGTLLALPVYFSGQLSSGRTGGNSSSCDAARGIGWSKERTNSLSSWRNAVIRSLVKSAGPLSLVRSVSHPTRSEAPVLPKFREVLADGHRFLPSTPAGLTPAGRR